MAETKRPFRKLRKQQRKQESGKDSIEMKQESLDSSHITSETNIQISQLSLHHSCDTLKYGKFLGIALGQLDKKVLIIKGKFSDDELDIIWDSIISEYAGLIKTGRSSNIFELYKKISYTSWKLEYLEKALGFLRFKYDSDIANSIVELGYGLIEYNEDRSKYLKNILFVEREAKTLLVLLNQYSKEYLLMCPEGSNEIDSRSMIDYDTELSLLSKFQGYRINKNKITVSEFASIVNNFLDTKNHQNNGRESRHL